MATTLTSAEILADVIDSVKIRFPEIDFFGGQFTDQPLVKGKVYRAHIAGLPTIATYDATTGYANGANEARSLLTDVDVTVDQHKHVPIKWDHLNQIQDEKQYINAVGDAGFVLAKAVVDFILTKAVAANFTTSSVFATADADFDMLVNAQEDMNGVGASPIGRRMLVNSAVASVLGADSRVASGDYHGQLNGADAYRTWRNIAGFELIREYPSLPSTGNMNAFAFTPDAFAFLAGPAANNEQIVDAIDAPRTMGFDTVTSSGITMTLVKWQDAGTGDVFLSPTLVYGAEAGAQGGSAGDLTDYSGHIIKTA